MGYDRVTKAAVAVDLPSLVIANVYYFLVDVVECRQNISSKAAPSISDGHVLAGGVRWQA